MSNVEHDYAMRYRTVLKNIALKLEDYIKDLLKDEPRIDRVSVRAKSVDSFNKKAKQKDESGKPRYHSPLSDIQDQIGARIVTYYLSDIPRIEQILKGYFRSIEHQNISPEKESEFGYIGRHFIFFIPDDILLPIAPEKEVSVFELQIKTLFQHAWSEAEHDLGYKPNSELCPDDKRKIAFTAAQAWGADMIFDELFKNTNQ